MNRESFRIVDEGFSDYPAKPPIDQGGGGGDNGAMETRVRDLEKTCSDMRVSLARVETKLDSVATKSEMELVRSDLIKWMVGTALVLASLAFSAAKLIH